MLARDGGAFETSVAGLGAAEVLDYTAAPFETRAGDLDAVIDTVGGDVLDRSWDVLKPGGIIVTIAAGPDEAKAEEHGVRTGALTPSESTTPILEELGELAAAGAIKAPVAATFPMSEVAAAHAASETGHGRGRRVLVVE